MVYEFIAIVVFFIAFAAIWFGAGFLYHDIKNGKSEKDGVLYIDSESEPGEKPYMFLSLSENAYCKLPGANDIHLEVVHKKFLNGSQE